MVEGKVRIVSAHYTFLLLHSLGMRLEFDLGVRQLSWYISSLVARPPLLLLKRKRSKKKKQGRTGNTNHVNDVWWMPSRRRREGGIHVQITYFIIERSNNGQDPRHSQDQQYS